VGDLKQVPFTMPASVVERIDAVVDPLTRNRTQFIRAAILEKLARIEREIANPTIERDGDG
jgi:hypothetical protein